jgi:hypothetical protein
MRPRRLRAIAGIAIAFGLGAPGSGSASASTTVSGRWVQTVPCLGISFPISGGWRGFHCAGAASWRGTWTGSSRYTADGAVNTTTGDAHGTIVETFRGRARDGRSGMLRFDERFVVNGATHRVHRVFEVVGSGGGFARWRGAGALDGVAAGPVATGTYTGKWRRRGRRSG